MVSGVGRPSSFRPELFVGSQPLLSYLRAFYNTDFTSPVLF